MIARLEVISDDHSRDRALTAFRQMIAIHGLTTIAHHCSILITIGVEGNVSPIPQTIRGGTGLPLGKSRKTEKSGREVRTNGAHWRRFWHTAWRERPG
jgi:hypothetical protein